MTTTFALIRAGYIAAIEALIPARLAGQRFRRMQIGDRQLTDLTVDLAVLAGDAALQSAIFRMFNIRDNHDDAPTQYTDEHTVRVRHSMSLDVAYPKLWGLYGRRDLTDMDDLIREDFHQIDRTIGIVGAGNWQPSQSLSDNQGGALIDAGPSMVRRSIYAIEYDKELGP